ncbi:MAG: undecaprenyl-diphosphatase UppP [Proteobacteria bacterium]|nr:undecaprenyl-diphosphatase UppP [Pseudomonadota bacterium]MBU1739398.1 undecaprenyl-diphosphatase UppP [Pseudomonadota bacterium]
MNLFYAILLGILQGATEFLPISSSGHLALAEHFLGLEEAGLSFDVALHLGTLLAILIYFRKDFLLMAGALLHRGGTDDGPLYRRLALYICIGTVPGVLAGLFLGHMAEEGLRQPLYVATALGGVGLFLLWAERAGSRVKDMQSLRLSDALIVGLFQALAIVPGVSRSGITMTAGLFIGFSRETAARFSFLLSAPIIFGAGVYKIPEIISKGGESGQFAFYLAGFLASAVSGYLCIAWLLKFIRTRSFDLFAYYRLVLAGIVYLAVFLG